MSSWTAFTILVGGMFLIVAVPFWSGRRYRAAMTAYRRLKAGETTLRLHLDAMVHGAGFGLGVLLTLAFFSRASFNAWQDTANGRWGLLALTSISLICLLFFRMGKEITR